VKVNPEFAKDLEDAGREITRCFIRAHISFDFVGTAVRELTDLRDHMVTMNQGPEALLVESAIGLLNEVEVGPPVPAANTLPLHEESIPSRPAVQRKSSNIGPDIGADASGVLPAAFFKPTEQKIMRDVAKDAYDRTAVGEVGWMRPDANKGETVGGFQAAVTAAEIMQSEGLILIRTIHHESSSGHQWVDAIQFMKMR